jgi:poly(3-hydroxybutyrate) depolymerase
MRRLLLPLVLVACSSDPGAVLPDVDAGADAAATADTGAGTDAQTKDAGVVSDAAVPFDASKPLCKADAHKKGLTQRTATNPYLAYVPASYDMNKPTPLVVALHGAGDTASNWLQAIWKGNADTRGFIVIVPEASKAYGNGFTWLGGDDDTIAAALADVQTCYSIDAKRVILDGFSAGGTMAYFVGLSRAQLFSGIGVAASTLGSGEYVNGGSLLPAPWKVPVSHFHGDADANFPIAQALAGINQLKAAGHTTYWHPFTGGHTTSASDALARYDDLKGSTAP